MRTPDSPNLAWAEELWTAFDGGYRRALRIADSAPWIPDPALSKPVYYVPRLPVALRDVLPDGTLRADYTPVADSLGRSLGSGVLGDVLLGNLLEQPGRGLFRNPGISLLYDDEPVDVTNLDELRDAVRDAAWASNEGSPAPTVLFHGYGLSRYLFRLDSRRFGPILSLLKKEMAGFERVHFPGIPSSEAYLVTFDERNLMFRCRERPGTVSRGGPVLEGSSYKLHGSVVIDYDLRRPQSIVRIQLKNAPERVRAGKLEPGAMSPEDAHTYERSIHDS